MTETRVRGIGRYVADLARSLMDVDWGDLHVRFLEEVGPRGEAKLDDDGAVATQRLLDSARGEIGGGPWQRRVRDYAARVVREADVDLFHQPHMYPMPRRLPCKNLVSCMDIIPLLYPSKYLGWKTGWSLGRRFFDGRRLRGADHIVAISQATKDSLVRELGIHDEKVTVVHLGIDHERFHPRPEPDVTAPHEGRYFLYVGDADWRKNHVGMFDALALVRREMDCELVCLGRLAPKRLASVERAARRAGVRNVVHLPGFVDDATLRAYYRHAVATLFVSFEEGFGFPVIEAMASGCPVITSDRSSMPEIAGDAAVLVSPGDPRAIADGMSRLLADDAFRLTLRERGLARAARFTRRAVAEKTVDIYRTLLEGV